MARPRGSKNKTEDAKAFVGYVEEALRRGGKADNLVNLVCRHLVSANVSASIPMIMRLLEMKFGKPAQQLEHTGKDGEQLAIMVRHIVGTQPPA